MVSLGNFFFRYRNGLFPLVYLLLLPRSAPLLPSFRLALVLGTAIALTGQLLRAVTMGLNHIRRSGKDRRVHATGLVQGGMYAHSRNPLYAGNLLILLGIGVASNSILFLVIAAPFFLITYRAIVAAEENFLRQQFGEEYTRYCQRVNRIVPNFAGLRQTLAGMSFDWRRLIAADYGSAFAWVAAITLVTLKNLWLAGEHRSDIFLTSAACATLAMAGLAYGCARFLKRSGMLKRVQAEA